MDEFIVNVLGGYANAELEETDGYQCGILARPCATPRALSAIRTHTRTRSVAASRIGSYGPGVSGALDGDLVGSHLRGRGSVLAVRSDRTQATDPQHDDVLELWLSAPRTAAHYPVAAERAKVLQAATTTPRLRRYLEELIARYERRAIDVEAEAKA
jgi:hypothetical protein